MCLAMPGRILEIWNENGGLFARADFNGNVRRVSIAFLPDLNVGEYIIIHAGFALTRVPPENVEKVMASLEDAGFLEDDGPVSLTRTLPEAEELFEGRARI